MAVMLARRQTVRTHFALTFLLALGLSALWTAAPSLVLWWLLIGAWPG